MAEILDAAEVNQPINIVKYRRSLLPWWIKGFSWLFMIFGALIIPVVVMSALGLPGEFSLYGMESNTVFSIAGASISVLLLSSGVVGFELFYGKQWAIISGFALCALHVAIFLSVMLFQLASHGSNIRLEIIIVLPFFIKLVRLNKVWNGLDNKIANNI